MPLCHLIPYLTLTLDGSKRSTSRYGCLPSPTPASARSYRTLAYSSSDTQLRDFENASRELGSSVGIVWSAFRLQERLAKILFLFRENAACLYPRKITRKPQAQDVFLNPNILEQRQDWRNRSTVPLAHDNLQLSMLPNELESFAGDVGTFISCLNEFEEFNDEAISQSMRAFEGDLRVRHIFYSFPVWRRISPPSFVVRLQYFSACLFEYKRAYLISLDVCG